VTPQERIAYLRSFFTEDVCAEYAHTLWLLDVAEAALRVDTELRTSSAELSATAEEDLHERLYGHDSERSHE
jgi:hypothetical protein